MAIYVERAVYQQTIKTQHRKLNLSCLHPNFDVRQQSLTFSHFRKPVVRKRTQNNLFCTDFLDVEHQECTVRPHIHFLDQPEGEAAFIWPFAIKVPRCAGSCYVDKDILQCTGSVSSAVNVQAYKFSYSPSRRRRDVMQEFANLEGKIFDTS